MTAELPRSPHAALAMEGCYWKGRKIEQLLGLASKSTPGRLLEVGAGSAWISHQFVHCSTIQYDADAVDAVYQRQSENRYRFTLVAATSVHTRRRE